MMSKTLSELKPDIDGLYGKHGYIDLSKLVGKTIKSVVCSSAQEFGSDATLQLHVIVFNDGTFMYCEGEHDFPYLVSGGRDDQPNCDQGTLNTLAGDGAADD